MKRFKYLIFIIISIFTLSLSSCDKPHTHSYIEGICECGEKDPNYVEKEQVIWKWVIDDEIVRQETHPIDFTPEFPKAPENAAEGYRWIKLDYYENGTLCYENILLYDVKICNIKFYDQNGNLLKEQNLEWGDSATAPEYSENYSVEWDKDFTKVKDDMIITGTINKLYSLLSFYDGEEQLDLGIDRYTSGDAFTLPEYVKEGYHFVGWVLDEISLVTYNEISENDNADYVFYAKMIRNDYSNMVLPDATGRITEIIQNGNYFSPKVIGSTTSYNWYVGDPRVLGASEEYGSLSVRNPGVSLLTAISEENPTVKYNCLVEATSTNIRVITLEELKNKELHTVTFKTSFGDILDEQAIPHGYTAFHPTVKSYDGYAFDGWDKEAYNITEDTIITANYVEGENRFEGKKLAIIGDSISTYASYMPEGYAHFYPYPAGDLKDVNHVWWKQVSNALGTSVLVNNAWGGTTVVGGSTATESIERLSTTIVGGQAPDIILIFIGTNDARANYKPEVFEASYRKMIANLQTLAPNAEIILCTLLDLTATNFYLETTKEEYNKVITEIASDNNIQLVDLKDVKLVKSDFIDSVHPNMAGHKKMADEVIKQLK